MMGGADFRADFRVVKNPQPIGQVVRDQIHIAIVIQVAEGQPPRDFRPRRKSPRLVTGIFQSPLALVDKDQILFSIAIPEWAMLGLGIHGADRDSTIRDHEIQSPS